MSEEPLVGSEDADEYSWGRRREKEGILQKSTEGVNILLGDPRKAVVKLSIPTIVAMSVQTIYSLTDTFWISELGADALAAVGFAVPFYVIQISESRFSKNIFFKLIFIIKPSKYEATGS
ncbi:MATE family efflux transporter [Methanosarcina sp. UBA5]|uniref:MATE family efflux transporter n=1 Tax=Methanosarcina sp. UBA5 TaxID=1915593 RepID=UPI0025D4354C|nr:MATE family efflux transporter [Methanosarcina sp. UBA5]